jgi:glutathione S-transferase
VEAAKERAAYLFNCTQRSHGNFVENHTVAVVSMLVAGLKFPLASATLGALWCIARVIYALGYVREDGVEGSGRYWGIWFAWCQIALMGMAAWTGWDMVMM